MAIPIVMSPVGDPVRYGIVASLAHPGGNITGVTLYGPELGRKRVEVLKELLPAIGRLGVLGNSGNPATQFLWEETHCSPLPERSRCLSTPATRTPMFMYPRRGRRPMLSGYAWRC